VIKKVFLVGICAWGVYVIWHLSVSSNISFSSGNDQPVKLIRGPHTVLNFPSQRAKTSAIIIFGSGDGGWDTLEEAIAQACQKQGYEVIGIDSNNYADTDYNLEILQSDIYSIAQTARARFGDHPPPLIVGGYSMGAAQSIAMAGGPHPPPGLVGVLVVDMLSRGRYGLRTEDQMNVLPTGPGTFGVADFAPALKSLRVVQWHAEEDDIDSREWLKNLDAPHREFDFPGTGHGYEDNRKAFIRQLVASIHWILVPDEPTSKKLSGKP